MIAMLVALAVATVSAPVRPSCTLSHLEACSNTNQLFHDKGFVPKIRKFVGKGDVDYLYHGRLADQQVGVLGGPPDPPKRLGSFYRFTACRPHSCMEKGAVVLDQAGDIAATAILHSDCVKPKRTDDCYAHDTLTLFVKDPDSAKGIVDDLTAWAKGEIRASYTAPGVPPERLDAVEVFSVANHIRTRVSPR